MTRHARTHILSEVGDDGEPVVARSIWDEGDDEPEVPIGPWVGAAAAPATNAGDLGAWRAAEDAAWRPLLAAAAAVARLDERLLNWPEPARRGAVARLASIQAGHLAWAAGAPVAPEALALDAAGRTGRARDDDRGLARAAWAARRLAARSWRTRDLAPAASERPDHDEDGPDAAARPTGLAIGGDPAAGRVWADALAALRGAQPATIAAAAEALWSALAVDDGAVGARRDVAVMKLAARAGRGGAPFAPLPRRRRLTGRAPADRLAALAADLADGAHEALARLDALQAWRVRAEAATRDLSGRASGLLIAALTESVAVTTAAAVARSGVSKAAVGRNLAILADRGLAREISGQGRYQVWTAAL